MHAFSIQRAIYSLFLTSYGAGFGDRLLAEVKKLTPKDIKIRVSSLSASSFVQQSANTCGVP